MESSIDNFDMPFIAKYSLVEDQEIIIGGQSTVYKAIGKIDQNFYAVKKIEFQNNMQQFITNHEIDILSNIRHKNIINLTDFYISNNACYLIFPWLQDNILEFAQNTLQIENSYKKILAQVIIPITDAIAHLHENGISHRDISAKNILVDGTTPKLTDFGAAWNHAKSRNELTGPQLYSIGYAPAKFGSGYRKDVYSLSVLFIEILSKKRIIERENLEQQLRDLRIDENFKKILAIGISEEPDNRYENAIIFLQELLALNKQHKLEMQLGKYSYEIVLSNKAKEELKYFSKKKSLTEADLQKHASSSLQHISIIYDDKGNAVKDKYWLIFDSVQLLLGSKEDEKGWIAITAHYCDSSELEGKRRKENSLEITDWVIPWDFRNSFTKRASSFQGYEYFVNRIGDWISSGLVKNSFQKENMDAKQCLDQITKIIDAQNDFSKGLTSTLHYSDCQADGKVVRIQLSDIPETDLTGSFWKINGLMSLYGEIDFHSGADVVLILNTRHQGQIKKQGFLKAEIPMGSEISLRRQREAVTSISDGTAVGAKLGTYLANPSKVPINQPTTVTNWVNSNLDDAKRKAVESVLGSSSITVIQGPPGTGKTTAIAEIVAQTLLAKPNSRILVVSQTHVAIDNLFERLMSINIDGLVRLANPNSERISTISRDYLLESQLRNWVKKLEEKSNQFILNEAEKHGISPVQAQKLLKLRKLRSQLGNFQVMYEEDQKNLIEQDRSIQMNNELKTDLISQIVEVDSNNLNESLELIRSQIDSSLKECFSYTVVFDDNNSSEILALVENEIINVSNKKQIDDKFLELLELQTNWLMRVGSSDQIASLFLRTCRVLAGTCIGFLGHHAVRDLEFDLCILDEASQATIPIALVPMAKSKKWVIVGDSRQLGAYDGDLPKYSPLFDEYGLTRENFTETFFSKFEKELPTQNQILLDTQYRMNNSLGKMISDIFYESAVKSNGPETMSQLKDFNLKPLAWIDTKKFRSTLKIESSPILSGNSISNQSEVIAIKGFLQEILPMLDEISEMKTLIEDSNRISILIVTPYIHQVEALKTSLSEFFKINYLDIEIMTIDSVQGRESDLLIYSPVRNNIVGNIGFINTNRLNVALSRGKHLLAIVGDSDFWKDSNSALSILLQKFGIYDGLIKDANDVA